MDKPKKAPDRRVLMSAACKLVQAEGTAWVTWRGERLKLGRPFPRYGCQLNESERLE